MEDNNQAQSPYLYGQLQTEQQAGGPVQSGEGMYTGQPVGQTMQQPMQSQPQPAPGQGWQSQNVPPQNIPGQNLQGQNQPYFQPFIPSMQPQKKRTGLLVGIILVAMIVVLALIGGLLYFFVWRTPQRRLAKGLAKMAAELTEYGNPLMEEIDLAEVIINRRDSGTLDLRMNMGLPWFKELPTIGMDFVRDYDYEAEEIQMSFDISAYNVDLFQSQMTVIDDVMYLEVPEVFSNAYSVNLATLGRDYNNSVWAELFNFHMDDNLRVNFFARPEEIEDENLVKLRKEIEKVFIADLAEIQGNMVIEESGDSKKIERNGKTVTCQGILVTINKDDLEELWDDVKDAIIESDYVEDLIEQALEAASFYNARGEFKAALRAMMEEELKLEFEDDLQICFYLDNKDRILAIETYDGIGFKNSSLENLRFSLEFTGDKRTLDIITGEIVFVGEGDEFTVEIEREIELDKEIYEKTFLAVVSMRGVKEQIEIAYVSSWDLEENEFNLKFDFDAPAETMSMNARGAFDDIEKGEAFTLELGSFNLSVDEETIMTLSGSMRIQPFEGDIAAPKDAKDFLALNILEIYQMITELSETFKDLGILNGTVW